jgi:transcriptional regulator with XRE-family HTH domain
MDMQAKKNIGQKIQTIREARMISVNELALRSNISLDQILQIEDNQIVPSLAPLIRIARSLGVSLGTLLDDTEQLGPVVTLAEEKNNGAVFSNKNQKLVSHIDFFALAGNKSGRHMEPFLIDLKPVNDACEYALSSHEGEEFIYVLDGCVEINYGREIYVLNAGDSIYYDSIVNHHVHTKHNVPSKILAVVYTPL